MNEIVEFQQLYSNAINLFMVVICSVQLGVSVAMPTFGVKILGNHIWQIFIGVNML